MSSERIADLLLAKIGLLAMSLGAGALDHAVRTRVRELSLHSEQEYEALLASSEPEQQRLIEEIVVSESWFFREPSALELLAERLLLEARTGSTLRVLCVPCANGEEPYSVVIALMEAGLPAEQLEVYGVDVSERAVSRARTARYARTSFRNELGPYERYFRADGQLLTPIARVTSRVQFRHGNVLDAKLFPARMFHAVFCRNLLIYLDKGSRGVALRNIAGLLRPNGLLLVGHSEASDVASQGFERAGHARHFAFTLGRGSRSASHLPPHSICAPARFPSPPQRERGEVKDARVRLSLARGSLPRLRRMSVKPHMSPREHAALEAARALADRGALDDAKAACERALEAAPDSADVQALLGVVERALGNLTSARHCFERVLSVAPNHQEALIHLALLAEASGDLVAARDYNARAACAEES